MTVYTKHTAATALAIVLGFAATPGKAVDTADTHITSINPSAIEVVSNGATYTKLKTTSAVRISGTFSFDTGVNGRIKKWEVWPVISTTVGPSQAVPGTHWFSNSEVYPQGDRPKTVNENIKMDVHTNALANQAVQMCNLHAAVLRSSGKSNQEIFSEDREVQFEVEMAYKVELTGIKNNVIYEHDAPDVLNVRCRKFRDASRPTAGTLKAPELAPEPFDPDAKAATSSQAQSRPAKLAPKTRLRIGG